MCNNKGICQVPLSIEVQKKQDDDWRLNKLQQQQQFFMHPQQQIKVPNQRQMTASPATILVR
jgi:uncharacterized membrane protein (DUF106 family)